MAVSRNKGHAVYVCATWRKGYGTQECRCLTISARMLDSIFWQSITSVISDPLLVEQAVNKRRHPDTTAYELEPINRIQVKIQHQIENYNRAISTADNDDVINALIGELDKLSKVQEELENMRDTLMTDFENWRKAEAVLDSFKVWCDFFRVRDGIEEPTYQEERMACEVLGLKVHVWKASHIPHFEIRGTP